MLEIFLAGGLFYLGYVFGYQVGKNTGYRQGWEDKEFGKPYTPPF
jgi:hypothetical protein